MLAVLGFFGKPDVITCSLHSLLSMGILALGRVSCKTCGYCAGRACLVNFSYPLCLCMDGRSTSLPVSISARPPLAAEPVLAVLCVDFADEYESLAVHGRVEERRQSRLGCLRPYHVENTGSRPITEVKQRRARLVLGWVTAWEYLVL